MSLASFVQAMPKVDLHVHLEGAMQKQTLLTIAELNEVSESIKHFNDWVRLLNNPDYARLDELIRVTSQWLLHPDDISRVAYDVALVLAKQNVRYAEVSVNPALYDHLGQSLDHLLTALNDGRERAQRAWGVHVAWLIIVPREEPRKADDLVRWAGSPVAKKAGVVGLGLAGREDSQPVGQFERPFRAAEKKGLPRVVHAGDSLGAEGILKAIEALNPNRIEDGWGAADSPEAMAALVEKQISLDISPARAVCLKRIERYADYPLRRLYDEGVKLTIGSDLPTFYHVSLNDAYQSAVEQSGLSLEELEELALNAVHASLLADEDKQAMAAQFTEEYARLRAEHIAPQTT